MTLFKDLTAKLTTIPRVRRSDLAEYCKLVARQLKCARVELSAAVVSGAGVFPVGKKNGRCREVWNGHDLSEASARPTSEEAPGQGPRALLDQKAVGEQVPPWPTHHT